MLNRASILGGKRPTLPSRQTRRLVVPGERIELSSFRRTVLPARLRLDCGAAGENRTLIPFGARF